MIMKRVLNVYYVLFPSFFYTYLRMRMSSNSGSAVRFGRESAEHLITALHLYLTLLDFCAGHDCERSCCNWSAGYVVCVALFY